MHVLLLYRDLNRLGGVPDDVRALCTAALGEGHEITAVAASPRDDASSTDAVSRLLCLDSPSDVPRLRRVLRNLGVDAAYLLPLLHPWNVAMLMLLTKLDVPLCVAPMSHAVSPHILEQRFGDKRPMLLNRKLKSLHLEHIDRPLLERSSLVRALSRWEANRSMALGAQRCLVMPEGFPEPSRQALGRLMGPERPDNATVFGYLGRLTAAQKGLDLLIPAIRMVTDELGPEAFHVRIAGPPVGDTRDMLQREVRVMNLNNVEFLGLVSGTQKRDFWRQCDYFLHFSRYETIARAVREAVSEGLPVLATRESNMGDWVVEGGFGYQVDLNPSSIAEAMIEACEAHRGRYVAMQSQAVNFARKWSWTHVSQELVSGLSKAKR